MTPALIIFLAACVVACFTDSRVRRIPNALTFGAIALALLFAACHGLPAFLAAFACALVTLLAGSVLLACGWLGGGDIKLLAAGAATIGFPSFGLTLVYIIFAGGFFAALTAWRDGRLRSVVAYLLQSLHARTTIVADPHARRVPYAFAICAGTCFFVASESIAPWLQLVH